MQLTDDVVDDSHLKSEPHGLGVVTGGWSVVGVVGKPEL